MFLFTPHLLSPISTSFSSPFLLLSLFCSSFNCVCLVCPCSLLLYSHPVNVWIARCLPGTKKGILLATLAVSSTLNISRPFFFAFFIYFLPQKKFFFEQKN